MTAQDRKTRWMLAKQRHWGAPVPAHLKHGYNTHAAQIYGCDCAACLPSGKRYGTRSDPDHQPLTATERNRKLREAKRGTPVPSGVKHGVYTYQVYRCRCDDCQAAHTEQDRAKRAAWRRTAIGDWRDDELVVDGFPMTVVHWPPRGTGMWECPDCLEKFPHRPPKEAS